MSDQMMNGGDPVGPEGIVTPVSAAPSKGGSGIGKIVLIIVGVIVALGVLGALAVFALGALGLNAFQQAVTTAQLSGNATSSSTTTGAVVATGALLPVPDITDRDIFTPRNPFKVIEPSVIETAGSTSDGSSSADTSGTLTLEDIVTENSVRKAVVKLDGKTYKLAAGDQVGDSSWSIVEVNSGSIVALYGDDRITISLGQGSSK